jgi:cytoskeletal protein CcmA (bactofilin family)
MAIFGSSGKTTATPAPSSARGNPTNPAGLSIIGIGMTVHGDIETAGVVKVEGAVQGHVSAGQQVLVAKGGLIDGDVDTGEAVVGGSVHGAVRASGRVEIQAGAVVRGDVTTNRIAVAEGAVLNGAIRMGDSEESAKASPPSRPVAQPALPRPSSPIARPAVPPRAASNQ